MDNTDVIMRKRLLVLEIPDYLDLHTDFKTTEGVYCAYDLMKHFKSYVLNPNKKALYYRSIEALNLFAELDSDTLIIKNRLNPFKFNLSMPKNEKKGI